ncbi:MAG: hypothetical protein JWN40_1387 [Phycisphaerales bacterium]|nr:hypothetical protein [Phycisphaerales bacterium]
MRTLTIRELDERLLVGRRIMVGDGDDREVTQCWIAGCNEAVPHALFAIYLNNGLIARIGEGEFGITREGQVRIKRPVKRALPF